MNCHQLDTRIFGQEFGRKLSALYGKNNKKEAKDRYAFAVSQFEKEFSDRQGLHLFSVPGRSEICGNHTDHQHGRVIAAAVDLDIIAVAGENGENTIRIKSEGFPIDEVSLPVSAPTEELRFTSKSLIMGMVEGFLKRGYRVGGFDAFTTSRVFKGSGLSSSAAFEVMVGNILNHLFNGGEIPNYIIAEIAQYSENVWFGKPSGLMDQTACAVGGFSYIDFGNPEKAEIQKLDFDLSKAGYRLCITDTGGNHADLNEDYASVPSDMKKVASLFGQEFLRGLSVEDILDKASEIRKNVSDKAFLRAYHFVNENLRVKKIAKALEDGQFDVFLEGINASGDSSFKWLQNVYTVKNPSEQGLSVALALSEQLLRGTRSAFRVHGGGFAGTVQAFVPEKYASEYKKGMEAVFGEGKTYVLNVRKDGAIKLA